MSSSPCFSHNACVELGKTRFVSSSMARSARRTPWDCPPHGVEKRVRIWIGPNISNTVPLGQSSSTWRVCGPPRSGRASSSRPRSRTRTRATRRRHTTRTNLTNSPIHYIKVVPRTTVSRLPYPMLGVAARSRDPTIS